MSRLALLLIYATGQVALGLWISRGIVERYGGDIFARNRDEGGACFTVRLKAEAP